MYHNEGSQSGEGFEMHTKDYSATFLKYLTKLKSQQSLMNHSSPPGSASPLAFMRMNYSLRPEIKIPGYDEIWHNITYTPMEVRGGNMFFEAILVINQQLMNISIGNRKDRDYNSSIDNHSKTAI